MIVVSLPALSFAPLIQWYSIPLSRQFRVVLIVWLESEACGHGNVMSTADVRAQRDLAAFFV